MPKKEELSNSQRQGRRVVELGGFLVAVFAVGVSIYFGVRSEQKKALEIRYTAKLALISPGAVSGDKVSITYGREAIANLSKLSLRVVNAGTVPVEARDIEEPLSLTFAAGKILEVHVTDSYPAGIDVSTTQSNSVATIKHGLLNPGDWIGLEILVDGQADWPQARCRISGVRAPDEIFPTDLVPIERITLVRVPKGIQYCCLVLLSLVTLACLVAGIGLMYDATKFMLTGSGMLQRKLEQVRAEMLPSIEPNQDIELLKARVAMRVWAKLPSGVDNRAKRLIEQIEVDQSWSASRLFEESERLLLADLSTLGRRIRTADLAEFGASVGLVIVSVALFLLAGGGWRLLLGISS